MAATLNTTMQKQSRRMQAVLALLRGDAVKQVSERYGLCRGDLYKFRRRALLAIEQAVGDQPRGPRRPYNRLEEEKERTLITLCQRYSTSSAQHVARKFGKDAPSLRTIQRIRQRYQYNDPIQLLPLAKKSESRTLSYNHCECFLHECVP